MVKDLSLFWQTNDVHVVSWVHWCLQFEQRHIVVESTGVVLWVDDHVQHTAVLVRVKFVLGLGVPLAGTNLQHVGIFTANTMLFQTYGCCKEKEIQNLVVQKEQFVVVSKRRALFVFAAAANYYLLSWYNTICITLFFH
jgi:hypothetical protein